MGRADRLSACGARLNGIRAAAFAAVVAILAAQPLRLRDRPGEDQAADEVLALAAHREVAEQTYLAAVRLERVVGERDP